MFKEYIGKLKAAVGEEKTTLTLTKSLFLVSMGSNDISVTYFLTSFRKNDYDIQEYTSMLVNMSSKFLQVCFWCDENMAKLWTLLRIQESNIYQSHAILNNIFCSTNAFYFYHYVIFHWWQVVSWWPIGHVFESGNSLFAYTRVRLHIMILPDTFAPWGPRSLRTLDKLVFFMSLSI